MKKAAAKVKYNKYFIVVVLYQLLIAMNSDLYKMPVTIILCQYCLLLTVLLPWVVKALFSQIERLDHSKSAKISEKEKEFSLLTSFGT